MDLELVEDFMVEAEDFMVEVAISAAVTLAAIMDGGAVGTAGTAVVTVGEAAVRMAAGIGVVGTVVPIGTGAAGIGTEESHIGGGIILTVTALLTTTTSGFRLSTIESRLDELEQCR